MMKFTITARIVILSILFPLFSQYSYCRYYEMNYFDIQRFIDKELSKGNKNIVIPQGTYRIKPQNKQHLIFKNLNDVTILAYGVEMICTETTRAITIINCTNLTIKGFTIDYDPLCFTQGRITKLSADKKTIEFKLDDNYPDNLVERIEIFDPHTGTLRRNTYYAWEKFKKIGERSYFVSKGENYVFNSLIDTEEEGDVIVTNNEYAPNGSMPHAIYSDNCRNLRLEDITLYSGNCFGFFETNGSQNNYVRCKIDRRTLEDDYCQRSMRFRSNNADAFHSKHAFVGPQLIACTARFQGDDGINICGKYYFSTGGENNEITLVSPYLCDLKEGDRLEILTYEGKRLPTATILSIVENGKISSNHIKGISEIEQNKTNKQLLMRPENKLVKLTIDKNVNFGLGAVVCNKNRVGNGFTIRDCNFSYNRSRGILIKASNGQIVNNTLEENWMHSILATPEVWWLESGCSDSLIIENNKIIRNKKEKAINIAGKGNDNKMPEAGLHHHIIIKNNYISESPQPAIAVSSTIGGEILNNNIVSPIEKGKDDYLIQNSKNIKTAQKSQQISITEFGLHPNTGEDARPYVAKALDECKKQNIKLLTFPAGRYDFYPSQQQLTEKNILKQSATVGVVFEELDNFTFDGGGAEFIYHGKMQIMSVKNCTNLTLCNFSVDWERPMISQAEIINAQANFLDIRVDKKNYPYKIKDGKVLFIGEGWELPIINMYSTLYDKESKNIAYNTWDMSLGENIFEQQAEEISEGIIRFHGKPKINPQPETMIVALFHVRYFANGITIGQSKDILLKDMKLYHSLGNAFLGYRTENITMDNASVLVNDSKGRYFSSIADASHFSQCAGVIKVENCAHTGQADDFINVHGTSVKITDIQDSHTINVASQGKGSGESITIGDEYWFIRVADAQRGQINRVTNKSILPNGKGYQVTFADAIPIAIQAGDFIECKTWCAGLELRNCKILKRNRARGILVTTPKDVIIEDNYFESAGTAILIEGDFNYWYESGANNNVQIKNNIFNNCLTSGNRDGSRAQWGEAVITITPSHIPPTVDAEPYHKNINITNNIFRVFDAPLVRAVSTRGLIFTNNTIVKTNDYKPYTWQQSAFLLDGCRDVKINNNKIDEAYITRNIFVEHMRINDVEVDLKESFLIKELKDVDTHMQW